MNKQQSGSVIVFTIVGIVLTMLMIGGIVVSQRRGDNSKVALETQDTSQSQSKNDTKQSDTSNSKTDSSASSESNKTTNSSQDDTSSKTSNSSKTTEGDSSSVESNDSSTESNTQSQDGNGPMSRVGESSPAGLPETGPSEDILMMTIGLLAILGSGYFYYHYGRS